MDLPIATAIPVCWRSANANESGAGHLIRCRTLRSEVDFNAHIGDELDEIAGH